MGRGVKDDITLVREIKNARRGSSKAMSSGFVSASMDSMSSLGTRMTGNLDIFFFRETKERRHPLRVFSPLSPLVLRRLLQWRHPARLGEEGVREERRDCCHIK